tara:strand:+ start:5987 stop:6985 length:999 start_codon:yes stop_codon:yes gene_type:complete
LKGVITIVCYDRIDALKILLASLEKIKISDHVVDVVFSIDFSNMQDFYDDIYTQFSWDHGEKILIKHDYNLGLKTHILNAMSRVENYDFNVILEDDLIISPFFMKYIESCLSIEDNNVSMYSLYSYNKNEENKTPFYPLIDSSDNYYIQFPSSWGFFMTVKQWSRFKAFMEVNDCEHFVDSRVPNFVEKWSSKSWKKHFCRYLLATNSFVCYPRFSLSTNRGISGTHETNISSLYSVPLVLQDREWKISGLEESMSLYDVDFELIENSLFEEKYARYFDQGYSLGSRCRKKKSIQLVDDFYIKPTDLVEITTKSFSKFFAKIVRKAIQCLSR